MLWYWYNTKLVIYSPIAIFSRYSSYVLLTGMQVWCWYFSLPSLVLLFYSIQFTVSLNCIYNSSLTQNRMECVSCNNCTYTFDGCFTLDNTAAFAFIYIYFFCVWFFLFLSLEMSLWFLYLRSVEWSAEFSQVHAFGIFLSYIYFQLVIFCLLLLTVYIVFDEFCLTKCLVSVVYKLAGSGMSMVKPRSKYMLNSHENRWRKPKKFHLFRNKSFLPNSLLTNVRTKRNAEAINIVPGAQAKQKQTRILFGFHQFEQCLANIYAQYYTHTQLKWFIKL